MRLLAYISSFALLIGGQLFSQELHLKLDRTEIKIGEQISAQITLSQPVTSNLLFPLIMDTLTKEIEVVEQTKIDTSYEGSNLSTKVYSQDLILTSFDTGFHTIHPIRIILKNGESIESEVNLISVSAVPVEMSQAPAQGQGEREIEIKEIKDIKDKNFSLWEFVKEHWIWFVLFLLLGAATWAYFKYVHPNLKKEGPVNLVIKKKDPPHQIAFEKLNRLEKEKLWQSGKVKLYYIKLSEILREYQEERYGFPALELTSHEIQDILPQYTSETNAQMLNDFFSISDLAKFAKANPIGSENESSMKAVRDFISSTKINDLDNQDQSV